MKPRYIVIHTAAPVDEDGKPVHVHQSFDVVRNHHVKHNGWIDIGYHVYIEGDGTVHDGRPLEKPGAHVEGLNYKSIGICCSGNGDLEPFSDKQLRALTAVTSQLMRMYDISIGNVLGHRECYTIPGVKNTGKTCPGTKNDMDHIRQLILLEHDRFAESMERAFPEPRPPEVVAPPPPEKEELILNYVKPVMPDAPKPWWQSKTTWVGVAQLVAGTAELVTDSALIGGEAAGVVATVGGVAMIALRFLTGKPITLTNKN